MTKKELIWDELQSRIDWDIVEELSPRISEPKWCAYKLFVITYDTWIETKKQLTIRSAKFTCSIDEHDIELSFCVTGGNVTHEDIEISMELKNDKVF